MKYLTLILLPFTLAITAFGEPASHDAKNIQGTWIPVKAEIAVKPMRNDFLTNTVLKLDDGKYDITVSGAPDKGTYVLDSEAKPKTMDITGGEGPNAGKKILCIYELKSDSLKICYALGARPRPTDFTSTAENKYFLVTYQRKKPK